jgi:cell division septation protein DedD
MFEPMKNARAFLYAVSLCGAGILGLTLAAPAFADVKAGVDAWTAGYYTTAVGEWRGPAANGDPDAQFNLAQAYRLGRGVEVNPKLAEALYAKAAVQGHLKAADNYGLLLFQDGRREAAMPYLSSAADRGDPRAQYLIGLAHFNGDFLPKDWVRAYALLTLSNSAGLPQAAPAIKQMDDFIPLAQREQAQSLAQLLKRDSDASRSAQLAAADLGADMPSQSNTVAPRVIAASPPATLPGRNTRIPQPICSAAVPPSLSTAQAAIVEASRVTGTESPSSAGADFVGSTRQAAAGPVQSPTPNAFPSPTPAASTPARVASAPQVAPAATTGPWKVQLGAFSVSGNAEKLWRQLSSRSELSGKTKLVVSSGRLTKLLAGGYPSRAAADQACAGLKRVGQGCLVTR